MLKIKHHDVWWRGYSNHDRAGFSFENLYEALSLGWTIHIDNLFKPRLLTPLTANLKTILLMLPRSIRDSTIMYLVRGL